MNENPKVGDRVAIRTELFGGLPTILEGKVEEVYWSATEKAWIYDVMAVNGEFFACKRNEIVFTEGE